MSFEEILEQILPFASVVTGARSRQFGGPEYQTTPTVAAAVAMLKELFPQQWEQVRDSLNGLMMLRNERVLLISPRIVVIH
jgi:hypothetical protein